MWTNTELILADFSKCEHLYPSILEVMQKLFIIFDSTGKQAIIFFFCIHEYHSSVF